MEKICRFEKQEYCSQKKLSGKSMPCHGMFFSKKERSCGRKFFFPRHFLFLLSLPLFFSSCSNRVYKKKYQKLKDFAFQGILENQAKEKKYHYPLELNGFFLRHQIDGNGSRYLFEFYNPEYSGILEGTGFCGEMLDDGSWIDGAIFDAESELYGDFSMSRPYGFVQTENGIEIIKEDGVMKRWISSNQRLNSMQFENEAFVPLKNDDGYVLINSSENQTVRAFYDDDFLLEKKEFWKISNPYESRVYRTEEYFYDEKKSINKKIVSDENSSTITFYDENALPSRSDFYRIEYRENPKGKKNGGDGEKFNVKYLKNRTLWRYSESKKSPKTYRLNIEESTEFFYKNDDFNEYSDKITRRQTYSYKNDDESIPPDYRYYENGKLKMKTVYDSKENYMTQVYFNDGYSVQSFYEGNVRKKDVYLINGIVGRTKVYE